MVTKTYSPQRGGTVKYSTGWFLAGKNRAKAMEEMKTYCGQQKAVLLAENNQKEFTGSSQSNSTFTNGGMRTNTSQNSESFVYLHFKCVNKR